MKIGIAGVPGTGKTTVANILSERLGIPVIHQSDFFKGDVSLKAVRTKFWWVVKKYEDVIIEGHLLCDIKIPLDLLVILRTNPEILLARLEERGYEKKKVDENVLAEALDYCLQNAEDRYENIIQIDTSSRRPEDVADIIERCINGEECIFEEVDWVPVLERLIISGRIVYV